ncbi:CopG family transcriptional regulator [Nocardia sp. NPDC057030]|uniref:ribbon-helix-helix domain-containing protein n=1 Tax=unclassified Nocardia TaxID=2637762 RepID=UPI00362FA214
MAIVSVYEYPAPGDYESPRKRVGFFDPSKALKWSDKEDYSDTGSGGVGAGQAVLLTAKGRWILQHWTLWQGQGDRHEYITGDQAREWLLDNNFPEAVAEYFGEVEEEDGPGRPAIGKGSTLRLGDELTALADQRAEADNISRAELIRRAVRHYLIEE